MEHVTIPIPDGLDATQKDQLMRWLTKEAAAASPERISFEDDAAWQSQASEGMKRAMGDIDAGRVMTSEAARGRLDAKTGHQRHR